MNPNRIPFYRVNGTHYQCAYQIGKLTRDAIQHWINADLIYLSPLFTFVQSDYGRKLHEDFIETIRLSYPWYWDEIRGLADGSQMPLEQIVVLNFLNETRTAYRLFEEEKTKSTVNKQQFEEETGEKGCTTVLINRKDTNIFSLLHNEDHSSALFMSGYLVEVDIQSSKYNNDKVESPKEKFLAYCYAGVIPGNAFGVNMYGFAYSVNGLYPNFVAHNRLPRQIVNRALLSVQNEVELDKLLHSSPIAFGFSLNGGFFHQQTYLFNYEIGPNFNVKNQNYISKCRIINNDEYIEKNDEDLIVMNYLIHYNHYERLNNIIIEQKNLQSTYTRWKRGQEFGEISTINDARRFLGDENDEFFPIFRSLTRTNSNVVTLCTVHIDFRTFQCFIYQDNPKNANEPSWIYNLKDLLLI